VTADTRRSLVSSALVFVIGALAVVAFIIGAAQLDGDRARQHVADAFSSGALAEGPYREIELVPGFLVMESDNYSTCVMLSQMLAPSDTVFAEGVWGATPGDGCAALAEAVTGGPTVTTVWYRYWHGASAVSKVLLTALPVQAAQVLLILVLVLLIAAITYRVARISMALGVGTAVVLLLTSDLPWQGLSLVHGVSSTIGLAGVLLTQIAFARRWAGRWGVLLVAGFAYAATAQMLTPIAFAIMAAVMAMVPLLRGDKALLGPWQGLLAGVLWVVGYAAGLASRYLWVAVAGPGLDQIQGELQSSAQDIYLTTTLIQPFHALVGLITKTWLGVGWMQVGLMVAFAVLGWILGTGGARGLRSVQVLVTAAPIMLGFGWLLVWAGHTNHTFVHVLLSAMLLNVLFTVTYARHRSHADT
jgi:hypothetical protein